MTMTIIRAQATLQGASGIAKDRYVNTWTFDSVSNELTEPLAENLAAALDTFYTAIDGFIPGDLTRLAYRFYNLSDEKPREPLIVPAVAQPSGASPYLPYEVAVVMSYYGDRNLPRRRGRVFLGPWTNAVLSSGEINSDPQVAALVRTTILDAIEVFHQDVRVSVDGSSATAQWGVLSSVSGGFTPAEHVWVDNAFDTQRRRGSEATQRTERAMPA